MYVSKNLSLTAKIEVSVEMVEMYEIDYSLVGSWLDSTLCNNYARFINEMQAMMTQFRLIVRLI